MNFIKLYIGDYQRDTGHLSIAEHGAYLLMLQHYYATEKPLPTGKSLHRLLRAETKTEREAIDMVSRQFWRETEAGLVNSRAVEEIRKADHQRTVNREIGLRGGRPKQTEPLTDSVSESRTEPLTDSQTNRNPNQTPDTRHQTPDLKDQPLLSGKPDDTPVNGKKKLSEACTEVLSFLNEKTGRNYKPVKANIGLIAARLKEGATVVECRQVIAKKCREWRDDPKQEIYLRPKTLFNATNFANYQGELVA